MDSQEFDKWITHHQEAFPSVAMFFKRIPKETRSGTLELWERTIGRLDLESAIKATDSMFAESDRTFCENHPAQILLRAKRDKSPNTFQPRKIIDGQESFRCLLCEDDGRLTCWHPEQIKHYRSTGKLSERLPNTCSMACTCAAGEQHHGYGKYNPRQWLPYLMPEPLSENVYRLADFLKNSHDKRRERAFDAFAK